MLMDIEESEDTKKICEETPVCCICLESENIKKCLFVDKIKHLPCRCNIYAHKYCFNRTDKIKCFVCRKEYEVAWGYHPDNPPKLNRCESWFFNTKRRARTYKNCLKILCYRTEMFVLKLFHYCYSPNTGSEILDCLLNLLWFICVLFLMLALVFIILLIGGYFFNLFVCVVNSFECRLWFPTGGWFFVAGLVGIFLIALICFLISIITPLCNSPYRILPHIGGGGIP